MNYTKLSNDLLKRIVVCDLSARQIRILLFILRQTIGYNRKTHLMSRSFIAKGVQADVSNVRKDLSVLLEQNFIYEIRNQKDVQIGIIDSWIDGVEMNPINEIGGVENNPMDRVENNPTDGVKNNPQIKKDIKEKNNILFDQFWIAYPRKEGKTDARKAFDTAIEKDSIENICAGARGYSILIQNEKREMKYIKLPAGWLRSELWRDYIHNTQQESTIIRLIKNQATEIDGETDERLQRAFLERRKQAGFL